MHSIFSPQPHKNKKGVKVRDHTGNNGVRKKKEICQNLDMTFHIYVRKENLVESVTLTRKCF